jgi:nicotinamide mononucleotide transporter
MSSSVTEWSRLILEWVAAGLGLGGVILGLRQWPGTWLCWLGSSLLYLGLMWQAALYGQTVLMGIFAITALWGYVGWRRASGPQPEGPGALRVLPLHRRWALLLAVGAAGALWFWVRVVGDAGGQSPWLDGAVTVLSLLAMALMAQRYLICWPIWGLVNALSVILFAQQALWATTALYAVQFVLSVVGYQTWRRHCPSATLFGGRGHDAFE